MFGLPYKIIGLALAALALIAVVALHFRNDARTRHERDALKEQASTVVIALKNASGNEQVTWETAPGQIVAMGESNRALKGQVAVQNERIDEMAAEAVRLNARASELRKIANQAEAQRQSALKRLSDMTINRGTRADCVQLLNEAEAALDLVRNAGA